MTVISYITFCHSILKIRKICVFEEGGIIKVDYSLIFSGGMTNNIFISNFGLIMLYNIVSKENQILVYYTSEIDSLRISRDTFLSYDHL